MTGGGIGVLVFFGVCKLLFSVLIFFLFSGLLYSIEGAILN